jgi:hypothetical protein
MDAFRMADVAAHEHRGICARTRLFAEEGVDLAREFTPMLLSRVIVTMPVWICARVAKYLVRECSSNRFITADHGAYGENQVSGGRFLGQSRIQYAGHGCQRGAGNRRSLHPCSAVMAGRWLIGNHID